MSECQRQDIPSCPYREVVVDGEDTVVEVRCCATPCTVYLEGLLEKILKKL